MTTTKRLLAAASLAAALFIFGCGGPKEGEPIDGPPKAGGDARGRLQTDQGAEQGISGGGESGQKPAAEPVPSGGS